jgi:hypothetical protein
VTLTAGGRSVSKPLAVEMDPRIDVPVADLDAQLAAGLDLRQMSARINGMIQQADDLIDELTSTASRPGAAGERAKALLEQAKQWRFKMGRLPGEQGYRIQGRLREDIQSLAGSIGANPTNLTAGEKQRLGEIKQELDKMSTDWQAFLKTVGGGDD